MSELLIELDRELKLVGDLLRPGLGHLGSQRSVKGAINLNVVEEAGVERQRVNARGWVEDARPFSCS